jgi:hypothetical protein
MDTNEYYASVQCGKREASESCPIPGLCARRTEGICVLASLPAL